MTPTVRGILIAKSIQDKKTNDNYSDCVDAAMQMYEWTMRRVIDWISDNACNYAETTLDNNPFFMTKDFIEDLQNAVEGDK